MQEALKKKAEFERRKREVSDGHCLDSMFKTKMSQPRCVGPEVRQTKN